MLHERIQRKQPDMSKKQENQDKKQTKRITIDLPLDIHARVTEIADSEDRSIRNYIFRLIKLDIMAREREQEEQKEE